MISKQASTSLLSKSNDDTLKNELVIEIFFVLQVVRSNSAGTKRLDVEKESDTYLIKRVVNIGITVSNSISLNFSCCLIEYIQILKCIRNNCPSFDFLAVWMLFWREMSLFFLLREDLISPMVGQIDVFLSGLFEQQETIPYNIDHRTIEDALVSCNLSICLGCKNTKKNDTNVFISSDCICLSNWKANKINFSMIVSMVSQNFSEESFETFIILVVHLAFRDIRTCDT